MAVTETQSAIYHGFNISLALFDSVSNCKELKQLAMTGKINATLLKPSMILDEFQVLVAANQAIQHDKSYRRITKSLRAELLYCLCPNKNISEAFRKFGMGESDTSVLVAEVHAPGQSDIDNLKRLIKGNLMDIKKVSQLADEMQVKKVYKVSDSELTIGTLLDAITTRIASKDFT